MSAQQVLWIALECFVSVALDWAVYDRFRTSLEVLCPRLTLLPYGRLSFARKLGIAVAGGLVAASAVTEPRLLLWAGLFLWLVLHATGYFGSAAPSEQQP